MAFAAFWEHILKEISGFQNNNLMVHFVIIYKSNMLMKIARFLNRLKLFLDKSHACQLLEADEFVCLYLRFNACYEDNNTTIRFSETISTNSSLN
jgi:hypothetical protein